MSARSKGAVYEREFVARLNRIGVPSRRIVGSGGFEKYDPRLKDDIDVGIMDDDTALLHAEVKYRRNGAGFTTIERWLSGADVLFLRRANADPMVVMEWGVFASMLVRYYDAKKREVQ